MKHEKEHLASKAITVINELEMRLKKHKNIVELMAYYDETPKALVYEELASDL